MCHHAPVDAAPMLDMDEARLIRGGMINHELTVINKQLDAQQYYKYVMLRERDNKQDIDTIKI